ncbi:hypothetical protein SEPCBS119000_004868 [Sporothrix epigloea]|uniref:Uncharacterized protein n=1 Tax=Sporothrix epigloea TaxID=1892477 RepID=A0ABP0DVP5_9PEZI
MLSKLSACIRRGVPASASSAAQLFSILLLLTNSAAHPIPDAAEDDPRRDLSKEHAQEKVNIVIARYELYTTTWTETETYTSTYSSGGPASAPTGICTPAAGSGQIACGNVCCGSWQYCAYQGQCLDNPGQVGPSTTPTVVPTPTETPTFFTTFTTTGGATVTSPYSPPYKATSGTGTPTGTALRSTGTDVGSGSTTSSTHLSGAAIAGIVIGTLAGIGLLIALCACVLIRGLWHTLLACFGIRRRREKENVTITVEEERYRHSGGGHSSWYGAGGGGGGGGGRPPPPMSEKKSNGGWLGLGAAAGTILLLLGLKRDKDHNGENRRRPPRSRSDVSSDYYTYSGSYMSGSRESRRSRGTRASRRSDPTRLSRSSHPSRPSKVSRAPSRR